ncbi:DUF6702 family protein [Gaetbulibacter aestuarii]|uniref:DUF6702 family protein n=1 Tax=Gaetbulibacter aestuarii TaxID=1502358 RepID=A0ABW7MY57_9FLAO
MNYIKVVFLGLFFTLSSFTVFHKYYVSVTQVNYVPEEKAVQIISRLFVDDIERALQNNYNDTLVIAGKNEPEIVNTYLKKYFNSRFSVKINGQSSNINFIGKEYDGDIMKCYLEIPNVSQVYSFEITDAILFDIDDSQKNIIKTNINGKQKSFILDTDSKKKVLNFN